MLRFPVPPPKLGILMTAPLGPPNAQEMPSSNPPVVPTCRKDLGLCPHPMCNGVSLGRRGAVSCLKEAEPGAKAKGPGRTGRTSLEG